MKTSNEKLNRRRKMALMLPVITIPFVIFLFWALGGNNADLLNKKTNAEGLNPNVPDPQIEDKTLDKLAQYEQAHRDSMKRMEERKNDPYFELANLETDSRNESGVITREGLADFRSSSSTTVDSNEVRVNRKVQELYRELNRHNDQLTAKQDLSTPKSSDQEFSSDVDRLEDMMKLMRSGDTEDPEISKLGGMLDKILDIQHPDRVHERTDGQRASDNVSHRVATAKHDDGISRMSSQLMSGEGQVETATTFFGLSATTIEKVESNSIEAVIHNTQEIVDGAIVKIRLTSPVTVSGLTMSEGEFVFGKASINGERLQIKIESIRSGTSILPVDLSVYDLDGIEGIYIPGAITRDAVKQSSGQAMQSLQFLTMDQSVAAQAASAGIQAAKGLFSKKVRLVRVTVVSEYAILLKDNHIKS